MYRLHNSLKRGTVIEGPALQNVQLKAWYGTMKPRTQSALPFYMILWQHCNYPEPGSTGFPGFEECEASLENFFGREELGRVGLGKCRAGVQSTNGPSCRPGKSPGKTGRKPENRPLMAKRDDAVEQPRHVSAREARCGLCGAKYEGRCRLRRPKGNEQAEAV